MDIVAIIELLAPHITFESIADAFTSGSVGSGWTFSAGWFNFPS